LFFGGQLISLIGTWMQNVAQSWLVYRLTGSSLLLGSVGFASQFPVFLLAPVGGTVADRQNRHRIVIATQVGSMLLAFALAALTLTHRVQVWHVFVLAALLGCVNAFDIPARQSFIVDMVGKEDLMNAIALNSSMFNGARVIGPAVAGLLVASIGEGWCFFANAVSYLAVITGLLMMEITCQRRVTTESPLETTIEGFRWVSNAAPIRALLLLLGLLSLVAMPYAVLMPIFADKVLHSGARGLGILMGFSGVGALIGALLLAAKSGLKGLGRLDRDVHCRVRREPHPVLLVARAVAIGIAADSGRHDADGGNGGVEHADPIHGSRRATRPSYGRLLDDVHGNGAVWRIVRRRDCRPHWRAAYRHHGCGGMFRRSGNLWFAAGGISGRGPPAHHCAISRRRRPARRNHCPRCFRPHAEAGERSRRSRLSCDYAMPSKQRIDSASSGRGVGWAP
jgi:MFS family permease